MTLAQWIAKYENKTGEGFSVPDGFQIAFDDNKGFFCFQLDYRDGIKFVNISHTSTNDWKWVIDTLEPLAKAYGAPYYATATKRNPDAYMKLTGATRKPEYDYSGYKVFIKEVNHV